MKKLFAIFLTLVYSLATLGVGLKEFYCCGKLKSINVSIVQSEKEKCGKGGDTDGCCKTKVHFFKVKDKHVLAGYIFNIPKQLSELDLPNSLYKDIAVNRLQLNIANRSHAPPSQDNVPTFIFNCVFRI